MGDAERSRLLRTARTRALARLRYEFDERFQELMDEEVANLGGTPRVPSTLPPRRTWGPEAKQKGTPDD